MECTGVPGALGEAANIGASLGGWSIWEDGILVVVNKGFVGGSDQSEFKSTGDRVPMVSRTRANT